jgi:c-di-GMP-binding flagellar brake protein YcgR
MPVDRRKFARVNYPCSVTVWHEDGAIEVILANTANISAGGLFMYLNRSISVGKKIEIKIDNFFEGSPLKCLGRVVRCQEEKNNKDPRQKFYEIGVEFTQVDDQQRQYLEGFVQRLFGLGATKNV